MLVGMTSKDIARKVAILPCVDEVVLTNGAQSVAIKKNDRSGLLITVPSPFNLKIFFPSVFIVPPGKPTHRNDFQIARVNEIRIKENSVTWLRVQLYEGIREFPT